MEQFKGKYVGLAPTGPQGSVMGEIEIVIDDRLARFRLSTGMGIRKESLFLDGFVPMSDDEVRSDVCVVASDDRASFAGFRHSSGFPRFFFQKNLTDGTVAVLMHQGRTSVERGPTLLLDERMVARGDLDRSIAFIEGPHRKDTVARLACHGRPPKAKRPD